MKKLIVVVGLSLCLGQLAFAQEATVMYFRIPANRISRVVTAFCNTNNYQTNKLIGETRLHFTKRMIRNHIRTVTGSYETKTDVKNHRIEIINTIEAELEDITIGTN
jgi:hypothetical protein